MAKLWLIAVLLLLSASAGSSMDRQVKVDLNKNPAHFQRPDEDQMTEIVDILWKRYQPSYISNNQRWYPMFSLAVSIPYDKKNNKYDVSKVTDDLQTVRITIRRRAVYTSERMVAARVLKWDDVLNQDFRVPGPEEDVSRTNCPRRRMTWAEVKTECREEVKGRIDHAEYRVLQNLNSLTKNLNKDDFLLFYVLASPCDQKCASKGRFSILESIKEITSWKNYALVFCDVFQPNGREPVPPENLKGALVRLGAQIGLQNIYRCNYWCTSCFNGDDVEPYCYSDDP